MAAYSRTRNLHATTTANVEDVITFANAYRQFEVMNRGGTDMWVRSDGVSPVASADGSDIVRSGQTVVLRNRAPSGVGDAPDGPLVVRVICTAAIAYSVNGL